MWALSGRTKDPSGNPVELFEPLLPEAGLAGGAWHAPGSLGPKRSFLPNEASTCHS